MEEAGFSRYCSTNRWKQLLFLEQCEVQKQEVQIYFIHLPKVSKGMAIVHV